MPLNTRVKHREPVNASAEFAIHAAQEQTVKINVPQGSLRSASGKAVYIPSGVIDISVSGCALESPYLIPPGIILDVKIDAAPFVGETKIERKDPIVVTGKVTSCVMHASGKYRLGVVFTKIEQKDLSLIDSFIALKERRNAPRWPMNQ